MADQEPVSVVPGRKYRYIRGGLYSPLGVGTHVHSLQEQVAYVGLAGSGKDEGRLFFTTLDDWARKFTPVEEIAAVKIG